jgi:ankyrin repeat protein
VVLILSHLPDPNVLNDPQYEPGLLHCAVDTGNLAVLKLLVEGKVALNTSFPLKGTALQVACARGNVEMVRFLLHHKADPVVEVPDLHGGYYHRSPLHIAADSGSVAIVEELLAHGTDPKRNPGILWVAARGGSTEVMSRLLDVPGVDINEVGGPDNYGDIRGTALHCAAGSGNLSMLKLLLDEGADPNLRTPFLGSPYDVAIKAGHQDCVTELRDG